LHLDRWLRFINRIGRPGDLANRSAIGVIALGERFLPPVLVDVATTAGIGRALAWGAVLSFFFAARGFIQSTHVARTEAGLYVRVVNSVLQRDVLQPSVLEGEEARAALFEGAHGMASLLAEGLPNLCASLVAATAFAVFFAVTQPPRVVFAAAVLGMVALFFLVASRRVIEVALAAESAGWLDLVVGVDDAFGGRLEIVAGGRVGEYSATFGRVVSSWSRATSRVGRASRLAGRAPLLALAASVGAVVVFDRVLRGEPLGQTIGHAALLASMAPPFVGVAQGIQELARSERRLGPMLDLVTVEPVLPLGGTQPPRDVVRLVELRHVHLAYERGGRRHEALRGVSFAWRAGELLALAGANGSGKSTCLRAILGLGNRSAGEVLIDEAPLESIDIVKWRRTIAFLPQRPYLPQRVTVRESLRFVDSDVTDDVMMEAVERVGLAGALRREKGPLDVRVDELSIGQRQRVGLARVICRKAGIIMLDEPDANLDHAGVMLVRTLVRELARDRLVIVAAHSSELLAAADRIVTLDFGRVAGDTAPVAASV
jgi:ABC-type multidrug transport system fused ATPase/permease subunit